MEGRRLSLGWGMSRTARTPCDDELFVSKAELPSSLHMWSRRESVREETHALLEAIAGLLRAGGRGRHGQAGEGGGEDGGETHCVG